MLKLFDLIAELEYLRIVRSDRLINIRLGTIVSSQLERNLLAVKLDSEEESLIRHQTNFSESLSRDDSD